MKLFSAVPFIHQRSRNECAFDRRIGQTPVSPTAEPGVYLNKLTTPYCHFRPPAACLADERTPTAPAYVSSSCI